MLNTHLRFICRTCLWNFHSKAVTRNFLTLTRPVAARSGPDVKRVTGSTTKQIYKYPDSTTQPHRLRQRQTYYLFRTLRLAIHSSKDQELVVSRVTKSLDYFIPHIIHPHRVYGDVVRFLIRRACIPPAIVVYERMLGEGLLISPSLEAQILTVALPFTDDKSQKPLFSLLRKVVQKTAFTTDDLLQVLGRMADLDLPAELLLEIMSLFDKSHKSLEAFEPDIAFFKKLVYSGARDGDGQLALDALAALPRSGVDRSLIPDAYATFFAAIRKSALPSRAAVTAAIEQMEKQGVNPTLSIYNALISFEARTNSLHRPFAIYDSLKGQLGFLPDDYTFGSLFNTLNRFYNPKRRGYRHGKPLPDNIPTPRALYRDMMDALVRDPQAPPFQLTTSLLNSVLRSFIFNKDYAGAYVVVRSFPTHRVPVDVRTYFIVFRHLMNRITYGIRAFRKMGSIKWADRFLDLPHPIHDPGFLSNLPLSNVLAGHILKLSKLRGFRLDWPLYNTAQPVDVPELEQYEVPSVEAMLGLESVPPGQSFDVVPLERLLKKALLTEMDLTQELGHRRPTSSVLSGTLASAKEEMIPQLLGKRLKRMREVQRSVDSGLA